MDSKADLGRQKKTQWTGREDNENYEGSETERKKIEEKWTEPKATMGHHQVDHHRHPGSLRSRRYKGKKTKQNIWINNVSKCPKFEEMHEINIQEAQQIPTKMNS